MTPRNWYLLYPGNFRPCNSEFIYCPCSLSVGISSLLSIWILYGLTCQLLLQKNIQSSRQFHCKLSSDVVFSNNMVRRYINLASFVLLVIFYL